jgi:hypothetical protein
MATRNPPEFLPVCVLLLDVGQYILFSIYAITPQACQGNVRIGFADAVHGERDPWKNVFRERIIVIYTW